MINRYFRGFLNYVIMVIIFFACIMSMIIVIYFFRIGNNKLSSALLIVLYSLIVILSKKYNSKISSILDYTNKGTIFYIVMASLILRILWVIYIPTNPTSDFQLMYEAAADAAKGQFYMFKGNYYFARFAHDTITVLYFSLFYRFSNNPLLLIKFVNAIYGTASVYLLYLVIKETMGKKSALVGSMIMAVFPAYVMYTSETMSENIALPFYLLSVYLFLKALKNNKNNNYLFLCGFSLSIGNLFRMVGPVVLIAFTMYILIDKGFKETVKTSFKIIITYTLPLFLISQTLIFTGITEAHLWNSKEPVITSILKGTNLEHNGRWNKDDAKIPIELNFDTKAIKKVSKEIIIKRLTETPKYRLVFHYIVKLSSQWGIGEFGAYSPSVETADNTSVTKFMKGAKSEINIICNLFYISLLIRILIALYNKEYQCYEYMNFFFILFIGFVLLYLITEAQERYSYIAAWLIVIFTARNSIEKLKY